MTFGLGVAVEINVDNPLFTTARPRLDRGHFVYGDSDVYTESTPRDLHASERPVPEVRRGRRARGRYSGLRSDYGSPWFVGSPSRRTQAP